MKQPSFADYLDGLRKIKKITPDEAERVIVTRYPLGRFYTIENRMYIGIDNIDGDAWVEEFRSLSSCKRWLNS